MGCGRVHKHSNQNHIEFVVSNHSDLLNIIIPFFDKYPLQGSKRSDYLDLVKVAELMEGKLHLTKEGLDQIRKIKDSMNTKRDFILP